MLCLLFILLKFVLQPGGSKAGTFDPYPSHSADPFKIKVPRSVNIVNKSGKTFMPSMGPKSTPMVSIVNQNVIRYVQQLLTGCVAQLVTCLTIDAHLTANPRIVSLILARSHTFVEIDHEIISTVILLPSAESLKKGCCLLQAKVCAQSTGSLLILACPGKSVVR